MPFGFRPFLGHVPLVTIFVVEGVARVPLGQRDIVLHRPFNGPHGLQQFPRVLSIFKSKGTGKIARCTGRLAVHHAKMQMGLAILHEIHL